MISKKHVASSKPRHLATAGEKFPSARDTNILLYLALSGRYVSIGGSPKEVKVYSKDRAGIVPDLRSEHVGRR
jgi:hypothetical protein